MFARKHLTVSQYRFIGFTHMFMDILPFLGKLSKIFQKEVVDFSNIKPVVDSTCESLKDLTVCDGIYVDKLSGFMLSPESGKHV